MFFEVEEECRKVHRMLELAIGACLVCAKKKKLGVLVSICKRPFPIFLG